jgi:hypothetical protein
MVLPPARPSLSFHTEAALVVFAGLERVSRTPALVLTGDASGDSVSLTSRVTVRRVVALSSSP